MRDSVNPDDFKTFTRAQAIANLVALFDDFDDEVQPDYNSMTNDELECEICVSGIVHDESMKGVFDTEPEALRVLTQARAAKRASY